MTFPKWQTHCGTQPQSEITLTMEKLEQERCFRNLFFLEREGTPSLTANELLFYHNELWLVSPNLALVKFMTKLNVFGSVV